MGWALHARGQAQYNCMAEASHETYSGSLYHGQATNEGAARTMSWAVDLLTW